MRRVEGSGKLAVMTPLRIPEHWAALLYHEIAEWLLHDLHRAGFLTTLPLPADASDAVAYAAEVHDAAYRLSAFFAFASGRNVTTLHRVDFRLTCDEASEMGALHAEMAHLLGAEKGFAMRQVFLHRAIMLRVKQLNRS